MPWWGIVLIVLGTLIVAYIVFALTYGKKLQRKQAEAEKQMQQNKQYCDVLIIDKKKMKMQDAGLPEAVLKAAPKYSKLLKMPIVKVKIQNRMMTLIADKAVYEILPTKVMCRIGISGIYITELKSVRGAQTPKIPEKKKSWVQKLREKAMETAAK